MIIEKVLYFAAIHQHLLLTFANRRLVNKDCTLYDWDEMAKYAFYALNNFKTAILEYLR